MSLLTKMIDGFAGSLNSSNLLKEKPGRPLRVNSDEKNRIITEGQPFGGKAKVPTAYALVSSSTSGTQDPNTNGQLGAAAIVTGVVPPGKKMLLLEASVGCSHAAQVEFVFGKLGSWGIVPAGGTFTWQKEYIAYPRDTFQASIVGRLDGTNTSKYFAAGSFNGYAYSAFPSNGDNTIAFFGDSNTEGIFLPNTTDPELFWHWIIGRKYQKSYNQNVRMVDKSISGDSSSSYEGYRRARRLDFMEEPSLIYYDLSTNDYIVETYEANLRAFISWALLQWKNTRIIILGAIPMQGTVSLANVGGIVDHPLIGTSREANKQTLRAKANEVVTSYNNPRVIFINAGLSFSVSDNTQFVGDGIHMSVIGHANKANYILNQIESNHPTFKQL